MHDDMEGERALRTFFHAMIYVSSLIACGVTLMFDIAFFQNNGKILNENMAKECALHLNFCAISAVALTLLSWVSIMGATYYDADAYAELATICARITCVWTAAFFLNILTSIYARYKNTERGGVIPAKYGPSIDILKTMRVKCLINALVMLLLSFLMSPANF